ncbi:hypothetical protein BRADI_3g03468v3 [Brachypodium distachyon]|uniref:Uncharacterized protein n=1 Tax=Brachypodium distachyon TaxID=15368 RepID=A0A2K2CUX4_BRADI|nr:hypothetical protein BRADI_3g03468v3 [Brachypodium distachyon]
MVPRLLRWLRPAARSVRRQGLAGRLPRVRDRRPSPPPPPPPHFLNRQLCESVARCPQLCASGVHNLLIQISFKRKMTYLCITKQPYLRGRG